MVKNIREGLPLLTLGFAILIALMSVLTVLQTSDGEAIMSGLTAIFGGEVGSIGTFVSVDVNFSLMNFVAFYVPILGAALLFMLKRKTTFDRLMNVASGVVVTLIFLASLIILVNLGMHTTGTMTTFMTLNYTYEGASLAAGGVLAVVFALLGTLSSALHTFIQFKK